METNCCVACSKTKNSENGLFTGYCSNPSCECHCVHVFDSELVNPTCHLCGKPIAPHCYHGITGCTLPTPHEHSPSSREVAPHHQENWEKRTMDMCEANSLSVSQIDNIFYLMRTELASLRAELVGAVEGLKVDERTGKFGDFIGLTYEDKELINEVLQKVLDLINPKNTL